MITQEDLEQARCMHSIMGNLIKSVISSIANVSHYINVLEIMKVFEWDGHTLCYLVDLYGHIFHGV